MSDDKKIYRRSFLQLMGATALTSLEGSIEKALAIPANNANGTIEDVEHIVILMQENRPFDHHFGTIRGVRGYSDPRAVNIHLPLKNGGTAPASVFLQPAGASNIAVPPDSNNLGGPSNGVDVVPPFRVNPQSVSPGLQNLGGTYLPGTGHNWGPIHNAWNQGQYDRWAIQQGPIAMNYMTREDVPYHCALADAFTVGDAYFCSVMGPTNPNRDYMWTGCIGNLSNLGSGGTDGHGAAPVTYNGLSQPNNAYFVWKTYPERLQAAGVTWKIYQDLAGGPFAPDFGFSESNLFTGNFGDCTVLYFNQYATAPSNSPLFQNACTGTNIENIMPGAGASPHDWEAWQEHLFDDFRNDVKSGKLPQVSWIVAPTGYTEHSDAPMNYGAWYISKIFDILVSNPEVFSKTVFIINYDEADGSFDHIVPPAPPQTPAYGASTVSIENEIVTTSTPNGPIGLAQRVPLIVISPWSKGGYVNSQVFDHTSVIQFIERRFRVHEPNISPWRRAVTGDLTSMFNFASPNNAQVHLPNTDGFLPSVPELAGGSLSTFHPTLSSVIIGVPTQEKGVRPARALPYEMDVHATVNTTAHTIMLTFLNTGPETVVFHVRSGNAADPVRYYTVEPGKQLSGSWNFAASYDLSIYGPNGFVRYYKGSFGPHAAALDVVSSYNTDGESGDQNNQGDQNDQGSQRNTGGNTQDHGSIQWKITNIAPDRAQVTVMDAYTGNVMQKFLDPRGTFSGTLSLQKLYGWYDLIITVAGDPSFKYRLAGHVETGQDSISDPALGGLVTLKG
jgi:phospholipase C